MKKWISCLLALLLISCSHPKKLTLHVFYNPSCAECLLLEEHFLPEINENIMIELHHMDEKESIEKYKEYLDKLENIDESLYESLLTPFIYLENGFGAIGYADVMKDIYMTLIEQTMNQETYTIVPSGVWVEKGE